MVSNWKVPRPCTARLRGSHKHQQVSLSAFLLFSCCTLALQAHDTWISPPFRHPCPPVLRQPLLVWFIACHSRFITFHFQAWRDFTTLPSLVLAQNFLHFKILQENSHAQCQLPCSTPSQEVADTLVLNLCPTSRFRASSSCPFWDLPLCLGFLAQHSIDTIVSGLRSSCVFGRARFRHKALSHCL